MTSPHPRSWDALGRASVGSFHILPAVCGSPGDKQDHESQDAQAARGISITSASCLISGEEREAQRGR